MEGEGFFKVGKGKGFHVKTNSGVVSVLGTQFNIKTRDSFFEVTCYKGTVQFDAVNGKKVLLKKGDKVKLIDSKIKQNIVEIDKPDWLEGVSNYNNAPLEDVIKDLEIQYGITIKNQSDIILGYFSGSFVHDNLEIALKTVFKPMDLSYRLSNNKKVVTIK